MCYTTFINLHYKAAGFINGDIFKMIVTNNIIYADNNTTNVTVFRRRGNLSDAFDGNGKGSIKNNKGYVSGGKSLTSWFGGVSPISKESSEEFDQLDASPFKTFNTSTGTYVLKPEYQGYGATIE